jgi:hypothetical protein
LTVNVHHIREATPKEPPPADPYVFSSLGRMGKPIGGMRRFLNAHLAADAIGAGLRTSFDVRVVPVSEVSPAVLADADLVVVDGPTHAHGMSRASTREAAVGAAKKPAGGLKLEPDALGPGLREWFDSLGGYPVKAATFDTRMHGPAALIGRASKGCPLARAYGFDAVAEPKSFLVTNQDRLEPQETTRARDWDQAGRGHRAEPGTRHPERATRRALVMTT